LWTSIHRKVLKLRIVEKYQTIISTYLSLILAPFCGYTHYHLVQKRRPNLGL